MTGNGAARPTRRRIPAGDLENAVIERLRKFFANRGELLDVIDGQCPGRDGLGHLIERGQEIANALGGAQDINRAIITALARSVVVGADKIDIEISQTRLAALLGSDTIELATEKHQPADPSDRILTLTASARPKRAGREIKLLTNVSDNDHVPDMALLRIIARAHDIHRRLTEDARLSVQDIAREEGITASYIYILLRLRWLAPDITTAIVNGQQPSEFNATKLMRLTAHLPADWAQQRAHLGFR